MNRLKINITNKKERAVLSDTLPYETPAIFSNRYFYDFLISNEIEISGNKVTWKQGGVELKTIIKILLGIRDKLILEEDNQTIKLKDGYLKAIPFHYKISHKNKEFRELTVVHPKSQVALVEFYEKYTYMEDDFIIEITAYTNFFEFVI